MQTSRNWALQENLDICITDQNTMLRHRRGVVTMCSPPSMSTLSASLSTVSVEKRTRREKRNVQMGSARCQSG